MRYYVSSIKMGFKKGIYLVGHLRWFSVAEILAAHIGIYVWRSVICWFSQQKNLCPCHKDAKKSILWNFCHLMHKGTLIYNPYKMFVFNNFTLISSYFRLLEDKDSANSRRRKVSYFVLMPESKTKDLLMLELCCFICLTPVLLNLWI